MVASTSMCKQGHKLEWGASPSCDMMWLVLVAAPFPSWVRQLGLGVWHQVAQRKDLVLLCAPHVWWVLG